MKVLLSHYPVLISGGAERDVLDLAVGLRQLGHDVYLYGPWSDCMQFVTFAEENGISVIFPTRQNYIAETLQTRQICKSLNMDAILSSSRRYNIIAYLSTLELSTVSVPVLHGVFSSWDSQRPLSFLRRRAVNLARALWWLILKRSPIIVCISKAIARDAETAFGRTSETTPVIYTGFKSNENPYQPYKKSASPFKLLLVGRLHKEKRPELIVPLMQEVLKRDKDVVAQLAGEGENRSELEELISRAGLTEHIKLLGHCEEISELYRSSHVLVHFRTDEGFGRVYAEAQMNGIPVVCTRGGAAAEVVLHGETGYLHNPADIIGMADSIIDLKQNIRKYETMCVNALVWSRQFSFTRMVQEYQQLLERITSQKTGQRGK